VSSLATNEEEPRERLISLDSAALPDLLGELSAELPKPPLKDANAGNATPSPQLLRLAWVIDELEGTDKLPAGLRRKYLTQRFASANNEASFLPLFEDTVCRALSHCSFADFCSICLEAAHSPDGQSRHGRGWMNVNLVVFSRRLATNPGFLAGDPANWPVWNQVTPANDPHTEIVDALPILIGGLRDQDPSVRTSAAMLADIVGSYSSERPDELVIALRDGWLAETDTNVRQSILLAMAPFATPLVLQAISEGLRSDREEIVSDAAAMVDWTSFELNDNTRADFERLVELTRNKNDQLRNRAVRSLRGKAPSLLAPEFERLIADRVEDIRKECAMALRYEPDPKYADILFKLADDSSEQVRIEALSSIGNLNHLPSMERLVPHLKDKKVWGYAVSALADMGGQDALPLMFRELESGNDVGGMLYQHLRRITGKSFDETPAVWLSWWNRR